MYSGWENFSSYIPLIWQVGRVLATLTSTSDLGGLMPLDSHIVVEIGSGRIKKRRRRRRRREEKLNV
jgi:hypothetical protein